ncbi:MAG: hypothetical protein ACI39W_05460 [Brotaphodocola sp.]
MNHVEERKDLKGMKVIKKKKTAEILAVMLFMQGVILPLSSCGEIAIAGVTESATCSNAERFATSCDAELLENDIFLDVDGQGNATLSDAEIWESTPSALAAASSKGVTAGDLWNNWEGSVEFSGEGTPECPYEIENLEDLMGLSEAVAAGKSFQGKYFELQQDIDLGNLNVNNGNWNPIGWYRNKTELSGEVKNTFQGNFDGGGNTISGLKIVDISKDLNHVGLFGVIENGSVKNLVIEGEDIYGAENVGVLAGTIKGDSVIQNVRVSGLLHASKDVGGLAGEVTGEKNLAVIENCIADGIVVYSSGAESFAGGIVGNLQKAYLVDCTAITQDGDYNRIYGKGYVGGIAGRMNLAQIYNVYVNGTIGGNGSRAAGGIVGKYESGNLVLARMAGDISRTNNGSASREGTFIGTRESRDSFTYGTERTNNLSYLFTNSAAKAKQAVGSTIDGDNSFTKSAHIGYWTDYEKKYLTVSGKIETACGDRYFYEELEDGVRYIITQKLNREYTSSGYGNGLGFCLDHFAPGYMGEPVRGYLVSIPRIDAQNDNGTLDTDVAVLTAIPAMNSYYRTIDKDHTAAIAPGEVVTVLTAPKNTGTNRYQMAVDGSEAGGVIPPVYLNEQGDFVSMQYVNGGSYTFVMPECDTELNVEYKKVTTSVVLEPSETTISIVHTRSGNRRSPNVVTEVKNDQGVLIARYIDGALDQTVEVQPISIHAICNGSGDVADRTVIWSVDDGNLLDNHSDVGYTLKDAKIMPNVNSSFVQTILNREIEAQADNQYREKISNTVYSQAAVVTASTNPETSVDQQAVYGNCRVNVTFQIVDHTTVRVDGMRMSQNQIEFTLTRKLTGKRSNPVETYQVTAPIILSAALNPEQPFLKNIIWSDRESGNIVHIEPMGEHRQECKVTLNYDPEGERNPAWIQNIILNDRAKVQSDSKAQQTGTGTYTEVITATSEDQTNGHITANCNVTIHFVTKDETYIHYSGGGSGGGSGRGSLGGHSSTTAVTAGPGNFAAALPDYVVSGVWTQHEDGTWTFADDTRMYQGEWAAVFNPYANRAIGQNAYEWFYFDEKGIMMTGWFTDADGRKYYLNPVSDGTQGKMVTGWNWIDGSKYYFNEDSDGTKGAFVEEVTEF